MVVYPLVSSILLLSPVPFSSCFGCLDPSCVRYGKLGANKSVTSDTTSAPTLRELWLLNTTNSGAQLRAKLTFATALHKHAGAPTIVWLWLSVPAVADGVAQAAERAVSVTFAVYNKSTTRLPESAFVTFSPLPAAAVAQVNRGGSGGGGGSGSGSGGHRGGWYMDKIGEWVSPTNSVDGAPHGLHGEKTAADSVSYVLYYVLAPSQLRQVVI
eukprot:COSAG06_NODE_2499_length_6756_cov_5.158780_3_plen_213_part_00